ncbi:SWR1 complex ATPase [Komagataella phaffii CBS 7435]|uniref:Helicase SWR1 n=2 Tax=Komagataella phaffii TaxID=460519 RepID=C4R6Z4_KOMPG|nr:Swi2/Snf2-related ATPase that is the structural component of the SWR1 complex [Komagataella phaffii GS115]AOA65042.1 GQ67_04453T0 [Komagataella phaffii]CAH2451285.1 SWR1 complex ATPase [Komagataella phaffii CBS 7435]AOA69495.1 GQ68_04425T0 [Komagataella phaffii GS115]CAY71369.1 Swi2/Snf2-related ATPase that is the structural component of the SWR1 complex [Komagataella phaffii GS115]CCA41024.1 SWR1 complex ATPase [Komagataella phaffii CBS 7435]
MPRSLARLRSTDNLPTRSSSPDTDSPGANGGKIRAISEVQSDNESAATKRRRTRLRSRDSPVNYSLKSYKRVSARPNDAHPSYLKESDKPLESVLKHIDQNLPKEQADKLHKENLCDILQAQEKTLDELFVLQNFTFLTDFDQINRSSEIYRALIDENNLWNTLAPENVNGRGTKRVHSRRRATSNLSGQESKLIEEVQDMLLERRRRLKTSAGKTNGISQTHPKKTNKHQVFETSISKKAVVSRPTSVSEHRGKKARKHMEEKVHAQQQESDEQSGSDDTMQHGEDSETVSSLSDSPVEQSSLGHLPKKVHLNFTIPKQIVTHPDHLTKPEYGGNLGNLLASFYSLDDDMEPSQFQDYISLQRDLVERIRKGVNDKFLKIDYSENVNKPHVQGTTREPTMIKLNSVHHRYKDPFRTQLFPHLHYDHLLAHGVFYSKLLHDRRVSRIQKAKKVANMIDSHFKKLSQSKEREEKENQIRVIKLARRVAKLVKNRWLQAEKVFRILEDREKEKERIKESKQHLSKILEHSTQLLEAQMNRATSASASELPSASGSDIGSSTNTDDENMSTSNDEEEEDANDEKHMKVDSSQDDSNLTVEELREKYKHLSHVNNEEEIVEDQNIELTAEEKRLLDEETKKVNPLFDSDDESESEISEDSEDMSMESITDEDDQNGGTDLNGSSGLASLFGQVKEEEDSDDESVKSDIEESDQEEKIKVEKHNILSSNSDSVVTKKSKSEASDEFTNEQVNSVIDVPVPHLLRGTLRVYQKQGLNWLASLYNNNTNGILADEMGLGKTIQTIALLSYLACEKHVWGPHLIIVPTSVMLNWEMEFKRFAPGFKVMTYYGNPQQRKEKRRGWNKPDSFHMCITSYQLVIQDHFVFRRKKWKYMILDEAHNIKNFRSQRWQALLNFNTEHRLLLTGTPLQNNIMELWSLLYFLMPSSKADNKQSMPAGFANLDDFQRWFGKPVDKMIEAGDALADQETKATVSKLHQVLRPYLLRRLKADVEKQMPAKYEHIVYCRLSKRQRFLYDDFMSRAQTKETLASGNFLSIINCLMQLRKVCNHPDLFEVRPVVTSWVLEKAVATDFEPKDLLIRRKLRDRDAVDLQVLNLLPSHNDLNLSTHTVASTAHLNANAHLSNHIREIEKVVKTPVPENYYDFQSYYRYLKYKEQQDALDHSTHALYLNRLRCERRPIYGKNTLDLLKVVNHTDKPLKMTDDRVLSEAFDDMFTTIEERSIKMKDIFEKYAFVTPPVVCLNMNDVAINSGLNGYLRTVDNGISNPFHQLQTKLSIAFPDKSLLQYDCGKLQKLASLLLELKSNGHRALIFTQMTKVLDILEQFLNIQGYRYMRLDGATKIEDRQVLTERFNKDDRITCFILSTRSGGLGINLTGADTVIFYDSDWNPAMDKQCQDRCHRIGQTRDVHIYRFVSEYTIESNILKKANQKRQLDNVIIQEGDFTTDYFGKLSYKDLLGEEVSNEDDSPLLISGVDENSKSFTKVLTQAEDADDAAAANEAMKEVELDNEDFVEADPSRQESVSKSNTPQLEEDAVSIEPASSTLTMEEDEYEEGHIDEYMIRYIASGMYWD